MNNSGVIAQRSKLFCSIAYARRGIRVFPLNEIEDDHECSCGKLQCSSAGKHPRVKDWQALATVDENQIKEWWRQWPNANIGIKCGVESNLSVLDVDGDEGRDTLRAFELEHGELPITPIATTGRGGAHYYFAYEPGLQNAVRFTPGLDVRTEGGLVVGVGSSTRQPYTWEAGFSLRDMQPSKMPKWLVDKIRSAAPSASPNGHLVVPEQILAGSRNDVLYKLTRSLKARGMSDTAIQAAVQAENTTKCKPPMPAEEVYQIIAHACTQPDQKNFQPNAIAPSNGSAPVMLGRLASEIPPQEVNWLCAGRIACGAISTFEGDPQAGKTTLSLALAAAVSTGGSFPDGSRCQQGNVIIISAEDSPATTIIPRLKAAGADLTRIRIIEANTEDMTLTLPDDLPKIEEIATAEKASLIIIDPLNAVLADSIDGHKDQHVRRALAPIAGMAVRLNAAVVIVRHLNKSGGSNALYRGGGSIGIIAAARAAFLIASDPDDATKRIFANSKNNLAPLAESLAFQLIPDGKVARVEWLDGSSPLTARDLLRDQDGARGGSREDAKAFLIEELKDGAVDSRTVEADASAMGISASTLRRAADELQVVKERETHGNRGRGKWTWSFVRCSNSESEHLTNGKAENFNNINDNPQGAQVDDQVEHLTDEHLTNDPLLAEALRVFPGSKIVEIRERL